jgi:Fe-S-cluster containining protein
MELEKIPFERFDTFHQAFNGEGDGMWQVCAECGGRCEIHKIGTLLPGEKEYMAARLNMSIEALENRYLDRLVTPLGTVDVLKIKPGCNFLDACYHCTMADHRVKPILCEIYPVCIEADPVDGTDENPELKVHYFVDELDCPLMHPTFTWRGKTIQNPRYATYRTYFEGTGIALLKALEVPAAFYQILALYDEENYDYPALLALRHVPADRYDTFTLEELTTCALGHDL